MLGEVLLAGLELGFDRGLLFLRIGQFLPQTIADSRLLRQLVCQGKRLLFCTRGGGAKLRIMPTISPFRDQVCDHRTTAKPRMPRIHSIG